MNGKRKKGFLFTLAAVALAMVVILAFGVYEGDRLRDKTKVVSNRILAMNGFVSDVEEDLRKGILITSTRTFLGIQEYVTEQGNYIPDVESAFEEGMREGTISGISQDLLVNATFTDWTRKIQEQAGYIGVEANITVLAISIFQQDPWNVNVTVDVLLNISDSRGTAQWVRERRVSAIMSITELEDPIYVVGTNGRVTNTIAVAGFTPFVSGSDVTNLMLHTNASQYVASNYSPSYLMRLEGDFGSSPAGIESLVNIPHLQANSAPVYDRSVVDTVYFGGISTTNHHINGTPSWFKIDEDRLETYGVSGLVT